MTGSGFGLAPPEAPAAKACKGCGGEFDDMPKRGMYANRCAPCRQQLAADRGSGAGVREHHARRREAEQGESFEQKARTLVSYGRRLDRAIADVRTTGMQAREARELAVQAVEDWKGACIRLAGATPGGGGRAG